MATKKRFLMVALAYLVLMVLTSAIKHYSGLDGRLLMSTILCFFVWGLYRQ